MKQKLLLFSVLILTVTKTLAFDFQDNGLYYKITSSIYPYEVAVTLGNNSGEYSGDVIIPSSAISNGITYSVTSIDDHTFMSCQNLTSITIPNSITKIGFMPFTACGNLTALNIEPINQHFVFQNGVLFNHDHSEIIFSSLNNTGVFNIPNTVTSIADGAFFYNYKLTSINIPYSVNSIGIAAFGLCSDLTSINVDINNQYYVSFDGVLFNIDKSKIVNCLMSKTGLFDVPNTVTSINSEAFYGCSGLTSINIPSSITAIGDQAFISCSGLTSIHAYSKTPLDLRQSSGIFIGVSSTCVLNIPKGTKSAYQNATLWKDFINIVEENTTGMQNLSASGLNVSVKNGKLVVTDLLVGELVHIYTTDGKMVASKKTTSQPLMIQLSTNKTYIVKVGKRSTKILL